MALKITKTELQVALAQATQTNKKTAGVFLDTLGMLAYKEVKKTGEFVLPGFGKLVKCAHGIQSQDAAEDQDSSQDRRQIPSRQGGKGRGSWGKEVVQLLFAVRSFWRVELFDCGAVQACRKSASYQT